MSECGWGGCRTENTLTRWAESQDPTQAAPSRFHTEDTWKVKVPKGRNVKIEFMEAESIHLPKERVRNKIRTKGEQVPPSRVEIQGKWQITLLGAYN